MKTAIIVDSACSLPVQIKQKYHVSMVPITYSVDESSFVDECDEQSALALFAAGVFSRKHEVYTSPPTPEDFEKEIIAKIKQGYNSIIVQTVNRTQGETYNHANSGVARVKKQLDGRDIPMRVMDSRTVFAGQALMAAETVRRMLKSKDDSTVRREMDKLSEKIHTYIVPKEPLVALERSSQRNESSLGWTQALIANKLGVHPIVCNVNDSSSAVGKVWGFKKAASALFRHTIHCIEQGLLSPILTINFCGPLEDLHALPGYQDLVKAANANKVMLITSVASICSGIYASVGSFSIAFAAEPHEWGEYKK